MPHSDPRLAAFGRAIRRLRRELDLSQDAVERRGGLGRNQVGAVERAEKDPQLSTVLGICDGLGVPLSEVVRRYEESRSR